MFDVYTFVYPIEGGILEFVDYNTYQLPNHGIWHYVIS